MNGRSSVGAPARAQVVETESGPGASSGRLPITTWSLEMRSARDLVAPSHARTHHTRIGIVRHVTPELSRAFYEHVGRDWTWVEQLTRTNDEWRGWVASPGYEMWVVRFHSELGGYLELVGEPDGDVEIGAFGLLPDFIGRGLGGWLLTEGVRRAWNRGARRVWVRTCSLDAPSALANYEKRGFEIYDTVETTLTLPPDPEALRVTPPPGMLLRRRRIADVPFTNGDVPAAKH